MKKLILGVCLSLSICMIQPSTVSQVSAATEAKQESEESFEYYEGKVTSGVNIRTGAGANKDKVTVDGKGVSLSKGTIVTIIDTVNVGDKPWYKIKFTYNDQELTGFATSSYIKKTGTVITPTPLPEPTATPTPKPTATVAPTKAVEPELTPVPIKEDSNSSDSSSHTGAIVLVVVLVLGGGILGIYFLSKKSEKKSGDGKNISEKVASLRDMVITSDKEQQKKKSMEHSHCDVKKKPEIRVSKGDKLVDRAELIHEDNTVYVKKSEEGKMESSIELDEKSMVNESAEKKALRVAISQLKEHDIVIHKFFGKGEVFDNSDVKLIEVRFGQDVRFLNKDQLVNKKLIVLTKEKNI